MSLLAPDLLLAHSCETENKWKETVNNVTNEQKFKGSFFVVRQAVYTAYHNCHFPTLTHYQMAGKTTTIKMLLYWWGIRYVLPLNSPPMLLDILKGLLSWEDTGSKGVTHDRNNSIKVKIDQMVTFIRDCSIGLGQEDYSIGELADGLFKTEPFEKAGLDTATPLQPLKSVG